MNIAPTIAQTPTRGLKPTLCVIEDDPDLRELLAEFLTFNGYSCWSTASTEGFLQQWPQQTADLAIVDLNLPGSSGLDIVRYLEPLTDVGVIVLTAMQETMIEKECLLAGADHYLRKPVQPDMLLSMIENLWQRIIAAIPTPKEGSYAAWTLAPGCLKIGLKIEVRLTPEEQVLLNELISRPNHSVSIVDLQGCVDAITQQKEPQAVAVLINRLRYRVNKAGQHFQVHNLDDNSLIYQEAQLQ